MNAEQSEGADFYSLADIVRNVEAFLRFLLKRKWILGFAIVFGAVVGAIYAHYQSISYKADVVFVMEEKNGSARQSGNGNQINISLNNLINPGSGIGNDNLLSILASKVIITGALLTPLRDGGQESLADLYVDMYGLRNNWKKFSRLANVNFHLPYNGSSAEQDSLLDDLYTRIEKKNLKVQRANAKSTVFKLTVTSHHNDFSRLMAERMFGQAITLYTNSKVKTERDQLQLLEAAVADSSGRQNAVGADIAAIKRAIAEQTPVVEVLEKPALLLKDERKPMLFWVLAFSIGAVFIYVVYAFLYFITRQIAVQ